MTSFMATWRNQYCSLAPFFDVNVLPMIFQQTKKHQFETVAAKNITEAHCQQRYVITESPKTAWQHDSAIPSKSPPPPRTRLWDPTCNVALETRRGSLEPWQARLQQPDGATVLCGGFWYLLTVHTCTYNLLLWLGMRDINAYCTVESYFPFLFVCLSSTVRKWLADLWPQNQDVPISAAFRLQKAQAPRPKARRERWKESKDLEKVKVMKVVKVVKVHQDGFLYFFGSPIQLLFLIIPETSHILWLPWPSRPVAKPKQSVTPGKARFVSSWYR